MVSNFLLATMSLRSGKKYNVVRCSGCLVADTFNKHGVQDTKFSLRELKHRTGLSKRQIFQHFNIETYPKKKKAGFVYLLSKPSQCSGLEFDANAALARFNKIKTPKRFLCMKSMMNLTKMPRSFIVSNFDFCVVHAHRQGHKLYLFDFNLAIKQLKRM